MIITQLNVSLYHTGLTEAENDPLNTEPIRNKVPQFFSVNSTTVLQNGESSCSAVASLA